MSGTSNLEVDISGMDLDACSNFHLFCSRSVTGACQGLGVGVDRTSVTHNKGWKPILGGKATGTRCQSVSVLCPNTCQLGILHVIGAMGGGQPRAKTLP